MNINYHAALQAYEAVKVNLPDAVRDDLYRKREANRNRLRANLPKRVKIRDFIAQGSMAIRTTIQEEDGDYDIDDGVSFYSESLEGPFFGFFDMDSDEVRAMVCDALKEEKFSRQPEILGNCVRVYYSEGYHVDVPSFRVSDADTSDERQQLAGKDGWKASDPTEINRWFEERVQKLNQIQDDAGGQFRRMIRLLKRFARSRGKQWNMPNGLKLTMLADECFERSYERDDKAFYFLLSNLHERLQKSRVVWNRAQPESARDRLTKSDADENMSELHQRVSEALKQLEVLWEEKCTWAQARAAWDWVFQTGGFFLEFECSNNNGQGGGESQENTGA
ncbi:MAG: hypothetical protein C5B50_27340 [Verrucomicrobia bacterium]|nr:MAG: hypothetical protein C5B50_27340 [Verrucomicrobiota bacterium]